MIDVNHSASDAATRKNLGQKGKIRGLAGGLLGCGNYSAMAAGHSRAG